MIDAFHNLPVPWMAVIVLVGLLIVNVAIWIVVGRLSASGRTATFKAMSPAMLTPFAVVFGLIIGFLAAQVWSDAERANASVIREASAFGTVLLLAASFPGDAERQIRALVRGHIREAVDREWSAMARQDVALPTITATDTKMLELALSLQPGTEAQAIAQREIVTALRSATDARRERIIVSRSKINWVKWSVVLLLALLILVCIAIIHCDNRATSALATGLFSIAIASCVVLIAAHNRPFTGQISVSPELLVQVMPKE